MNEIIKGEIPFVRILIPIIVGICAAFLYSSAAAWDIANAVMWAALCIFYLLVFTYKRYKIFNAKWLPGLCFHFFLILLGYNIAIRQSQKLDNKHFSATKYSALAIKINSEPKLSGDILRFTTEVGQGILSSKFSPATGKLLIALKVKANTFQYRYGDVLLIPADYNEVEPSYNPGEFNYKAYLANQGVYYQSFIREDQIQLLERNAGNPIIAFSYAIRQKLVARFNRFIADKDAAAVASTLILGYRADLSKEVLEAYSKTGTMHVLSVSGMHVGIVFIVLSFLLKFMDRNKALKLTRAALMILLIWAYALLTGFSPSVCRSALMLTILVLGKAINRKSNGYNLVAASAVLLLLYNPYFLLDVGFQLSYLAVLGLVYIYPKLYHLFYIKNWAGDKLWSYSSLSISAQAATFPVSMYYFHQFPLYFLISNIFILLPVTLIMYAGLAFFIFPFDAWQQPIGFLLEKLIVFTNKGLFYIENLPYANIGSIWISTWFYLLIYGFLLMLILSLLYQNKKWFYVSIAICMFLFISASFQKISLLRQTQIVFYSLRKDTAIGFFDRGKATVFTNLNAKDKTYGFSIQPSLDLNGIEKHTTLQIGSQKDQENIFTDGNFLQFKNWKLLVCDSIFNYKQFTEPIFVDAILLRKNPQVKLKQLVSWIHFNSIFVDGTNPDYKIHQWQNEANVLGCKLYVLKKNPAYIVTL